MSYITQNFLVQEFVPREIWNQYRESSCWFIDPRLPRLAQYIRDYFGKPMTINNWHSGGQFNARGFRPPTETTGAKLSQHRFGRAFDFNLSGLTSEEIRQEIRKNFKVFNDMGLTTIEKDTPTWVHVDIRTTNSPTILEVPYL